MQKTKEKNSQNKSLEFICKIFDNLFQFLFILAFVIGFQTIFGSENTLIGVAIGVGMTMFPKGYTGVKRYVGVSMIILLYTMSVIVGQFAVLPIWLAIPVYFLYTVFLLALSIEPDFLKPSVTFLLCFVFAQSSPVKWSLFPRRLAGTVISASLVAFVTYIYWKKNKQGGIDGRNYKEQIAKSIKHKSYIMRMSIGLTTAMTIAYIFNIQKPLWISIVVMSLTQISSAETFSRLKYRAIGTIVGSILFLLLFINFVPNQYHNSAILFIGYIGYFFPDYKYKQVINAISALYASLVIFNAPNAIFARSICFVCGAIIVVVLYAISKTKEKKQKSKLILQ